MKTGAYTEIMCPHNLHFFTKKGRVSALPTKITPCFLGFHRFYCFAITKRLIARLNQMKTFAKPPFVRLPNYSGGFIIDYLLNFV